MADNPEGGCCGEGHTAHNHEGGAATRMEEEILATEKVINAFFYYKRFGREKAAVMISQLRKLPLPHQKLVAESHSLHVKEVLRRLDSDYEILKKMVTYGVGAFGEDMEKALRITQLRRPEANYTAKVSSTIRQIVREWTTNGKADRDTTFLPILEALQRKFPEQGERADVRIFVPGCGLGRLPWDLVCSGFSVTGNEYSLFMLMISCYLLNACTQPNEFTLHPYLFDKSNSWSYEDQLQAVQFPDTCPSGTNNQRKNTFAMCAGNFLDVTRNDEGMWDVVVTAWFIDTANNIMEYIDHIHKILRSGGVWINVGPLTYHYEDADEFSIELPFNEVRRIILASGFNLEEERRIESKYTWNPKSMLHNQYECAFFVATKANTEEKNE